MESGGNAVIRETDGPVTILTINYPERRNALSMPVRDGLIEGMEAALDDENCRAIVLTGSGAHFCAGGDITTMEGITAVAARKRLTSIHRLVRMMVTGEKPVVAAVEGHAAGAGMSIAACCDIVVASEGAKFTCSFNRIGLVPDLGAAWVLPMRMGLGRARYVMMTGRPLDADKAERWGLAELVVPAGEARAEAVKLARELATKSPLSNGFSKALTARMPRDLDELLRAEVDAQAVLFTAGDIAEGRQAFLEKREPRFANG